LILPLFALSLLSVSVAFVVVLALVVVTVGSVSGGVRADGSRGAVLTRTPRFFVLAALAAVAAWLGVFGAQGDGLARSTESGFAELGGPWATVAFVGGCVVADVITAGIVGAGLLTVAMSAYIAYVTATNWRGKSGWQVFLEWDGPFWFAAAAVAGLTFGLCGWLASRENRVSRAAGFSVLAAFLLAETAFSLTRVDEGVSWSLVIVEGLAAVVVVGSGIWRSSARLVATAVPLVFGVAIALSLLAFATFPVLRPS
jgi:hypothetical protein